MSMQALKLNAEDRAVYKTWRRNIILLGFRCGWMAVVCTFWRCGFDSDDGAKSPAGPTIRALSVSKGSAHPRALSNNKPLLRVGEVACEPPAMTASG